MSKFIEENPINDFLSSCNRTFYWTYLLRKFVSQETNTAYPSLDECFEYYNPNNITKKRWGNAVWYLIHFLAKSLPKRISESEAISYKAMIVCLQNLLPCEVCRTHMKEHLREFHIDDYLKSRDDIFEWTVILHNKVSQSLGKHQITLEEAKMIYY